MFRSYDHPQEAHFDPYLSYSLKHSVIYFIILIWCRGSVSCVLYESNGVLLTGCRCAHPQHQIHIMK